MAAFSFPGLRSPGLRAFIERMGRSRFFTISLALHFLLVLTAGGIVLVKQTPPHTDFDDPGGGLVAPAPPPASDAVQPLDQPTQDLSTANTPAVSAAPALSVLTTTGATTAAFSVPNATLTPSVSNSRLLSEVSSASQAAPSTPKINNIPTQIAKGMKNFTESWRSSRDSGSGVGKDRAFKFTAYIAKYQGGDWDATVRMHNGQVDAGSLPNLLYIIRKWSRDRIDAQPDAEPMDLSSDALFTVKPPFVFFTGHRDFTLTPVEIDHLQKYLQLGARCGATAACRGTVRALTSPSGAR